MTKAQLLERLYRRFTSPTVTKKLVTGILEASFDEIIESLQTEGRFAYPGFGVWTRVERSARKGRHAVTGKIIDIPPTTSVSFRPAASLRDQLSQRPGRTER